MRQVGKNSIGKRGVLCTLLAFSAFLGMVFWSCSGEANTEINNNNNYNYANNDSSSSDGSGNPNVSSSSGNPDGSNDSSSSGDPNGSNDSNGSGDSNGSNGSSSSAVSISSSSHIPEVTDPGANCAYQPSWCGTIPFEDVQKESIQATDVGAEDKGQKRPNCIYATEIVQIGNESAGISINGTTFAPGSASRCGGDSGHGNGSTTPCATKFASIAKVDGGYYIYVPAWAGQDFKTTGGQPVCSGGPGPQPGSSASQSTSSSSAGTSTGGCVEPMYGVPPGGVTSCVKKDGKCYTCNPERGSSGPQSCSEPWVWQINSVSDYWYKEVSCSEIVNPTYNVTCTGLAQTGVAGAAITQPTVKCNADNVANPSWTGAPASWSNPVAGTYNISATANCGGNKTVSCGTIVVSAVTNSDLTCTGLNPTGVAGTEITQPTVKCGTTTVTSGITWTGAPTWSNPTANTYTVSVSASCGGSSKTASCGSIKVNPKLACSNPTPATVIAGNAVTKPTVSCGSTNLTDANITWSGAPTYWTSPDAGTYNNIKATATSGDCSGQTATCGTLTVNNKLTCASATNAITVGQTVPKPKVECGTGTTVTSGITWAPAAMNSTPTTAQTISNITATATCGGSSQTASCAGTITVTANTPSSSSGGNSSGSGSTSYTPKPKSGVTAKTTQYWDACKPSCSWSSNAGGKPANACSITGTNIGHNDGDGSACNGGSAFACMNQAPRKVGNVSFGYAAANMGNCGDCYQLIFPNNEVMVVMKNNIGNLNEGAAFDLMIPGGGVGDFNALTRQVQNSGVSNPDMGVTYGGFRGACGWQGSGVANCVKQKCESVFANLPDLKAGCLWYVNTLGTSDASFNNPVVDYQKVDCPSELTSRY